MYIWLDRNLFDVVLMFFHVSNFLWNKFHFNTYQLLLICMMKQSIITNNSWDWVGRNLGESHSELYTDSQNIKDWSEGDWTIGGQTGGREGSGARLGLKFSKICLGPPLCFFWKFFKILRTKKKNQPGRSDAGLVLFFGLFAGLVRGETPPSLSMCDKK